MRKPNYFVLFIIAAIVLANVPIAHWPFSWLEVYFHEMSHGLAAVITGGSISRIVLNFDGSGLCYTFGGWGPLVTFSGYAGASIFGAIIYLGARMSGKSSNWLSIIMVLLIGTSAVLWARDINTWIIILIICAVLYLSIHYTIGKVFPYVMEFAGVYVMVSAVRSPTFMINNDKRSDGDTLASLTLIPEIVWVAVWCSIAVFVMFYVWKKHKN